MQEPIFSSTITQKYYTERAILIATFIGGPLAGGYLIAKNFGAFGQPVKKKLAWLITIGVLLLVFGSALLPFFDAIPGIAYSLVFCLSAHFLARKFQGHQLYQHQAAGGAFYGTGRAVAVGFISLVLMLALIFGFDFLADIAGGD